MRTATTAMSSRGSPPWKSSTSAEHTLGERRRRRLPRVGGDDRRQALLAEELVAAARLGHSVGVEHERVARLERHVDIVEGRVREHTGEGSRPPHRDRATSRHATAAGVDGRAELTVALQRPSGPRRSRTSTAVQNRSDSWCSSTWLRACEDLTRVAVAHCARRGWCSGRRR